MPASVTHLQGVALFPLGTGSPASSLSVGAWHVITCSHRSEGVGKRGRRGRRTGDLQAPFPGPSSFVALAGALAAHGGLYSLFPRTGNFFSDPTLLLSLSYRPDPLPGPVPCGIARSGLPRLALARSRHPRTPGSRRHRRRRRRRGSEPGSGAALRPSLCGTVVKGRRLTRRCGARPPRGNLLWSRWAPGPGALRDRCFGPAPVLCETVPALLGSGHTPLSVVARAPRPGA